MICVLKNLLSKQEIVLEEFIMTGIDRRKVASMIYGIHRNNGEEIDFTEGKPNEVNLKYCLIALRND